LAVRNLTSILELLRPDVRETLADLLLEIQKLNPNNWRVREEIAI
jgi:hypothetical protein